MSEQSVRRVMAQIHLDEEGRIAGILVPDPTPGAPGAVIEPAQGHTVVEVDVGEALATMSLQELPGRFHVQHGADGPRLVERADPKSSAG
jgi:hypothetical protein